MMERFLVQLPATHHQPSSRRPSFSSPEMCSSRHERFGRTSTDLADRKSERQGAIKRASGRDQNALLTERTGIALSATVRG